ncbi:MAG: ComEC/Rec2 family competence protein [Anaerolineae bacterium]
MNQFARVIRRIFLVLVVAAAPFCCVQPSKSSQGNLVVHFLDVGQGDAIWLHLPNGDDVLVDGGPPDAGPGVVNVLKQNGVEHLDLIVATHNDADHIGGLINIVNNVPVKETWLDKWECDMVTCATFHQLLAAQEVITSLVKTGDSFILGSVLFVVLNPDAGAVTDDNNHSIVLRISHGFIDFLLTGDIEAEAEQAILASGAALESEILKVAHHGSATSSGSQFLSVVQPEVAVISVGANPYGHPSPEVLQRLAAVSAQVMRTDLKGNIEIITDGESYQIIMPNFQTFLPLVFSF